MRLLILVLAGVALASAKVNFEGYSVFRTTPTNGKQLYILEELEQSENPELDFWKSPAGPGEFVDIMVSPKSKHGLVKILEHSKLYFMEIISNVQELIDGEENSRRKRSVPETMVDFNNYNRFDVISSWLDETAAGCGSLCEVITIGQSYEDRPLKVMKVGAGTDKPALFFECGVHAREWIAPAVCINLINKLISDYGSDQTVTDMVDGFDWYILASANPDGYEYTHTDNRMWRKTRRPNTDAGSSCVGTDPNRNFGHHWGEIGASTNPCSDTYMGPNAFSEAETAAIENFLLPMASRTRCYMAVHSYGQYFLIPWSYTPDYPEDFDDLELVGNVGADAVLATHGRRYTVGHSTHLLGATAGSSDDWAKGDADVKFAYTLELRDTGFYGFLLPPDQIQATFEEVFNGLAAMAEEWESNWPMDAADWST